MNRAQTGFTLMEVLISLLILFIVATFMMELFIGGFSSFQRSRNFTTATFLATEKAEETLYRTEISEANGNFYSPFSAYSWTVSVRSYNANLNIITVDVSGPRGEKAHLVSLKKAPLEFWGVSVDSFSNTGFFARRSNNDIRYCNELLETTPLCSSISLPSSGIPGGVATDPYSSGIFAGDIVNKRAGFYEQNTAAWLYSTPGDSNFYPTGIAIDQFGTTVWVGDKKNMGIWKYTPNDLSISTDDVWSSSVIRPSNLGEVAGVATDPYTNAVWVADYTNNCLRKYDEGATPEWDTALFKPADGLKGPRGIAITGDGDFIYVVDSQKLWRVNISNIANPASWSFNDLPSYNPSVIPSGLAIDPSSARIWLNDIRNNKIWYSSDNGASWSSIP